MSAVATTLEPAASPAPRRPYGRTRLVAGLVGRSWLWFIIGCLLVTLVPMLFGWRPYVIESGSMEPRIGIGDVVLASPVAAADQKELLGRVTVFDSPEVPGKVITHRVVRLEGDTIVTKGDANQSVDSASITMSSVRGLGPPARALGGSAADLAADPAVAVAAALPGEPGARRHGARARPGGRGTGHEDDDGRTPRTPTRPGERSAAADGAGDPAGSARRAVRPPPSPCSRRTGLRGLRGAGLRLVRARGPAPAGLAAADHPRAGLHAAARRAELVRGLRRHDQRHRQQVDRAELRVPDRGQQPRPVPVLAVRGDRHRQHRGRLARGTAAPAPTTRTAPPRTSPG